MSNSVKVPAGTTLLPFCVVFPLLCIAFSGCVEDGCQGALNYQSDAIRRAVVYGGWVVTDGSMASIDHDKMMFTDDNGVIYAVPSLSNEKTK